MMRVIYDFDRRTPHESPQQTPNQPVQGEFNGQNTVIIPQGD